MRVLMSVRAIWWRFRACRHHYALFYVWKDGEPYDVYKCVYCGEERP